MCLIYGSLSVKKNNDKISCSLFFQVISHFVSFKKLSLLVAGIDGSMLSRTFLKIGKRITKDTLMEKIEVTLKKTRIFKIAVLRQI